MIKDDITFDDILKIGHLKGRELLDKIVKQDMENQAEKQRALINKLILIKRGIK